jgi:hypothetical protein
VDEPHGKYLDWHLASAETVDYQRRWTLNTDKTVTSNTNIIAPNITALSTSISAKADKTYVDTTFALISHTHTSFASLQLSGTLAVTGTTTLTGNLTSNGTTALKNTAITGTLSTSGLATLNSLSVTNATAINGNLSLSASAQTYLKNIMYPIGIVIERMGTTNPSAFYGGTWSLIGVSGCRGSTIVDYVTTYIIYTGRLVSVNINCLNATIGNSNKSYEFDTYGFLIETNANELIPMNFMYFKAIGKYLTYLNDLNPQIIKNSSTKITVDSAYGFPIKYDYVLSFTTYITDYTKAANYLGVDAVTKWKRVA